MSRFQGRPAPAPTPLSQPFWDACQQGELRLQCCAGCGAFRFYPSAGCPQCGADGFDWRPVAGTGRIYSWIVVNKTHDPYWRQHAPYVCAIVELDEQKGLFMPAILEDAPEGIVADMPVKVGFEASAGGQKLPVWHTARS